MTDTKAIESLAAGWRDRSSDILRSSRYLDSYTRRRVARERANVLDQCATELEMLAASKKIAKRLARKK